MEFFLPGSMKHSVRLMKIFPACREGLSWYNTLGISRGSLEGQTRQNMLTWCILGIPGGWLSWFCSWEQTRRTPGNLRLLPVSAEECRTCLDSESKQTKGKRFLCPPPLSGLPPGGTCSVNPNWSY